MTCRDNGGQAQTALRKRAKRSAEDKDDRDGDLESDAVESERSIKRPRMDDEGLKGRGRVRGGGINGEVKKATEEVMRRRVDIDRRHCDPTLGIRGPGIGGDEGREMQASLLYALTRPSREPGKQLFGQSTARILRP